MQLATVTNKMLASYLFLRCGRGHLLDSDGLCALVVLLGELEVPQKLRVHLHTD
jgi:hypothetical protein